MMHDKGSNNQETDKNRHKLILLSDGTGNSSNAITKSNVWRLYKTLDLECEDQIAFYDDGVGTSSFRPLAILGGAFGYGLAKNVRQLYAFACRHYQPDTQIYMFGFSRGAVHDPLAGGDDRPSGVSEVQR